MNKNTIPTIIGIIVLVLGISTGVLLVRGSQIFRLGAAPEVSPKDVRITNISDSAFTVSWVTDKETSGFIKWGANESGLDKNELTGSQTQSFTHTSTISGLTPETSYFFKINSGGSDFDNSGIPWQVKSGPTLAFIRSENLVSGEVLTASGNAASGALVYLTLGGSSPLSTITSESGSWVIPVFSARTQDLTSYIPINETSTLVEISVNAGPEGIASAQIYPQSARPVPSIILGQVHDFKSLPPSSSSEIPKASIGLPEISTPSSGFTVPENTATPSASTVTLESLDEGEIVTTTKPAFFGEGPPGVTLTITVESDPITTSVKVPSNGDWNFSPPTNLDPGIHTITITWKDAGGILRTLTRSFIVQAAEGPAFESTPSATPKSSPTASPSATPKATPTPTSTSSATPTAPPTPESGSLTPTFALSIMGIGILAFSFLIWKKSNA